MRDPYGSVIDDYVSAIGPALRTALPATAIRNRSLDARHLLVRAAIGDAGTLDDLLDAARTGNRRWLSRIRRRVDTPVLAALAQTLALQDIAPDDRRDALGVYELIRSALGPNALSPANQGLHAQLALAWDGPEKARELLDGYRGIKDVVRAGLEIDLLNPFVAARPAGPWLAAFRTLLPPPWPSIAGAGSPVPFDRLTAPAPRERVDAPQRVSVVVTSYRPGEGLITAIRSILGQTWSNVEVILVDDASPAEFEPVLRRAVALGDRIRLVRLAVNSGTYAARNAGLDASGGEFVTFQDSDDWSHPRRLEWQVRPLLNSRRVVATTSDGISVTDDLRLTRIGVRSGRLNPSSLLFRRTAVTGRIGYFDRVRKAADSEYIGRIQAAFGARAVQHVGDEPVALIRLSAHSLSRSEIKAHWMHPARVAYSSAYLRWHRLIARGEAQPFRPADGSGRPFAAPAHLLTGEARTRSYDVVMVADWRFLEGTQFSAVAEIRALTGAGMRVAVAQLESYRAVHLKRMPLAAPVQELINAGLIDQVLLGERVDAGLLIVRQASVLQFASGDSSGIRAPRALVVADRAPVRGDGVDRRYVPATCNAAMLRLFEVDPVWCPQDAGVRAVLRTVDPALPLTSADLPIAVDASGWTADRAGASAERPIAGTDLCDAGAWPADVADALAVHHRLSGVDVRLRLPDRPQWTADLPGEWLGYAAADLGPRPFLHQLDFYLHFPHRRAAETFSRPALEAAALGCVVVLPERYAARYGDAAVYCEPDDVDELIHRYAGDRGRYAEQSRRARAVVARAHEPRVFAERIAELVRPPVTAAATTALPMQ
jgi:glycosyltransferase involved in cell wall biosynthesis